MSTMKRAGVVVGTIIAMLTFGWWQVDGPGKTQTKQNLPASLARMDFRMTNHRGIEVSPRRLVGNPTMVFFGFTYCPDICPNTLMEISQWIEALGDDAKPMNVIFVTVDPERDDVKSVAEYLSNFNPQIEGWIGNVKQLADASAFFGVTYRRVETDSGAYSIDHTSGVFLYRADGSFARTIDYHEPRELAIPKIKRTILEK